MVAKSGLASPVLKCGLANSRQVRRGESTDEHGVWSEHGVAEGATSRVRKVAVV